MSPEKAWAKILSSPLLLKCMENGRDHREKLAAEILLSSVGPANPTTPTNET